LGQQQNERKVQAMKDYATIASEYHCGYASLATEIPNATAAFGRLVMEATANGALSTKTKELIAFAIAISVRCDGCIAHHSQAVVQAGATRQEVAEMIGVAILMGGGPASVYGAEALRAYDEAKGLKPEAH
jgi:AhpD family alkylhydroperoxidase